MGYFKKPYYILLTFLFSMLFFSCVDDMQYITEGDSYSIVKGDKVEVHLKVNLDNTGSERIRTRAGSSGPNDGIHNPDYTNPGIGRGTLATTLIYQLYDESGAPVALPNPDSNSDFIGLHQVRVENRQFPYSEIVFTVDNGKEYTMIFWAQSGEKGANSDVSGDNKEENISESDTDPDRESEEENGEPGDVAKDYSTKGDWFYDTSDLNNIIVRYDSQNERGEGQMNNTDSRDVFCAKVKFTGGQPLPDITLKRVVSQINIGFSNRLWERLERSNVNIRQSSIWIANVGRRFNLYKNQVELFSSGNATDSQDEGISAVDNDDIGQGGITWPFTMGSYTINTIPTFMKYPGTDTQEEIMLRVEDEDYYWVSMCYILAPGETVEEITDGISIPHDLGSTVDIVNMKFFDVNGVAYDLPFTELSNVPVKRNFRTNILLDELFNAKVTMDAQIAPDPYDDFGYSDGDIIDGELTPGLTYKEREGFSHWNEAGANGFEFYVSSLQGLKWLADRSNGLDFKLRDIPDWMIKKEGWEKLSNEDKLKAYEDKIFNLLFNKNRYLLYSGAGKTYAYRNEYGYRMPITFDDCIIYLTNDLDFNDDQEILNDWHGFSCNMSYYNGDNSNGTHAQWYMTSSRDRKENNSSEWKYEEVTGPDGFFQYSNTQTNNPHGFKGTFDGQGYTIYNMVINNLYDFYEYSEMTGEKYGPRKLHNSGLICTAADNAEIKDVRLYNAYIKGDYNIGGFVGYRNGAKTLTLDNCRLANSRIEGAEPQRYSPSDDANVGGIGGSLQGAHTIKNCQIANSVIISTFIGGAVVGIPGGNQREYSNNKVFDTHVILTELNNVGTINGSVNRNQAGTQSSFFFGQNAFDAEFNDDNGDCSQNTFLGIKYAPIGSPTNGATQSVNLAKWGMSNISEVPLEYFPDIYTEYAQTVTLDSHITGNARSNEGTNYGIKIDISGQPKTAKDASGEFKLISNDAGNNINTTDNKTEWHFTLSGSTYNSLPIDGWLGSADETGKYTRQNVLLISPNGLNDVKGVYVCAPNLPSNATRFVTIKDVIIAGEPSVDYGLYLDKVKEMYLDHVAIYDVRNAFGDENVPAGAKFKTYECDFRGITNIGVGYSSVIFENTAFNKGSGRTENIIGRLYAKSSAEFKKCMFRVDYKIVVEDENALLTFDDCRCGPPYNQVNLTKENFWRYMDSTADHPFRGKVKFVGDDKEYTYEDLLNFRPQ